MKLIDRTLEEVKYQLESLQFANGEELDIERELSVIRDKALNNSNVVHNEIHICKVSGGWKLLFQSHSDKFSNFQELKEYYKNNKKNLIVMDEYDREIKWSEFLDYIIDRNVSLWNDLGLKSHLLLGFNNEYYLDVDGFEWTNRDFA